MLKSRANTHDPRARFVILGASNVARGISTIVETVRLVNGQRPVEIFAAFGHGRSFGLTTRVLARTLPGMLQCRLWDALERRAARLPLPTAALVTDIGNDILYGVEPRQIASWVQRCLQLLLDRGATVVMTRLPMCSISTLGERRYAIARGVLYPSCRLELLAAQQLAAELDARLAEIARSCGVTLVDHEAHWYGFDPVHIRMLHWPGAWRSILGVACNASRGGWSAPDLEPTPSVREPAPGSESAAARPSLVRWARLKLLAPDIRWIFGFEQRTAQPGLVLRDGTSIWAY